MALLGFIFPLFISPGTWHLMVEDYSLAYQRDRGKKKEEEEKSPEKTLPRDRDLNPRTLSPEPSMLSIRPRGPAQVTKPTAQKLN